MKSNPFVRGPGQPYAVSLGLVAFAALLRLWPLHVMGTSIPFVTFYPAVIAAALLGGLLAGSLATLLSSLVLLFVLPVFFQQPFIVEPADWLGLAIFATSGLISSQLASSISQGSKRKTTFELDVPEQDTTSFVDSSTDAILTTTLDGIINHVNPAAERLLGYRADEVVGKLLPSDFYDVAQSAARSEKLSKELGRAIAPGFDAFVTKAHGGEPETREWMFVRKDGSRFRMHLSISVLRDSDANFLGFLCIARDVTAQRQMGEEARRLNLELEQRVQQRTAALSESERQHRTLLGNLQGLAYRCRSDADWTMEFVSDGCRELFGIAPDEFTSGRRTYASLVHPEDLAPLHAECDAAMNARTRMVTEYRIVRPDGAIKWVWEKAQGIFRDDGTLEAIEGFIMDITERKLAESRSQCQQKIFELLASDAPLNQILTLIVGAIEAEDPSTFCSVLLVDESGKHLVHGAAPSLPDFFNRAVHGIAIGPEAGSCGTSAFLKKRVIVADIQTSPLWMTGRELAAQADLRACWSEPIIARDGRVLGAFATYHREPREPNEADIGRISWATDFARLSIERKRAAEALAESQRFAQSSLDALSSHIAVIDEFGKIVSTNAAWSKFGEANGLPSQTKFNGLDYLAVCESAVFESVEAGKAAGLLREILSGKRDSGSFEYECHSLSEERWFLCSATRFAGDGPIRVVVSHENITTIKQAQRRAEKNERRFADLLEFSPDAIVVINAQGHIVSVNRQTETIFGYAREELIGQSVEILLPEHLRGEHVVQRLRYLEAPTLRVMGTVESDLKGRRKDGGTFPVDISLGPIEGEGGRLVLAAVRDITDRRRAEQSLRDAEVRYRVLFEANPLPMWAYDRQRLRFIAVNEAAIASYGYSRDEFLSMTVRDIRPAEELPALEEHLKTSRVGIHHSGPWKHRRKDGRLIDVEIVAHDIFLDGEVARLVLANDITERLAAQAKSREALATLDATDDCAFIFDPDTLRFTYVNQGAVQQVGYTREELLTMTPLDLKPDYNPTLFRKLIRPLVQGKISVQRFSTRHRRKDGTDVPVEISLQYVTHPGNTPRFIAIARDITERQKALTALQAVAEELREANATIDQERASLAERVTERTAELLAANERLVQASRFKSEFLATMSHELRTPLNGVLGMNQLLLQTPLTDDQRELVEANITSGRALFSLINDVLDLSKIEAGKIELDLDCCELEALAYDVITMFKHLASQKGVTLSCRLDAESCVSVMCDETRLRQVLVNLLGNALKFTSAGSVTLESRCVRSDDRQIVVRLIVSDTGPGIPEDKLNSLFAPFSQVDSSSARHYGGTGLGLSICKQLVELMGGTIGVTSRLGAGSSFWLEVPFDLVRDELKTAHRRQILAGNRVLAVDGIDMERMKVAECLAAWGCTFSHVRTLREAIESLSQANQAGQPFTVILADCRLAIGDEFVYLQRLARDPKIPVVGLGIGDGNNLATHLRQIGLRHFLRDPIRPSALFNALSSVLAVSRPGEVAATKKISGAQSLETKHFGHILVAEDNHINQMLIREMLKLCGCTCAFATDGREVLNALQKNEFDLVLMDCQMPRMDGFATAREIRRLESSGMRPGHLPIIALTANALKGDRERCLDAGMDEYLSKPIEREQIQAMLQRFLKQPGRGEPASGETVKRPSHKNLGRAPHDPRPN